MTFTQHSQDRYTSGELEQVKPGMAMFGEMSPGYDDLARVLGALRSDDILLDICSSRQVILVETAVPPWLVGHDLNWRVNLVTADRHYFGRNVPAPASEGLPPFEPLLARLMDS